MAKIDPGLKQAHWEGGEAAANGTGRSTNPYPQSDVQSRNAWFAGYDEALVKLSRKRRVGAI